MTWPGITDFSEAIQSPSLCFAGTELEAATVAVNQRGMPLVFSGAFACVYSVSTQGQTFAVRCFTREVKDQQSRYNELSNYLINVLPPSFVHFQYLEEGIRFKGSWYPMVKMEWVEGEVLSGFVDSRLGEPDTLRRIAAQWRGGPTASLRGLRIAHNDLQHGNVMVQSDGRIRLVDYDGMFLPKFSGERSPELGHKNYQHPERSAEDYGEHIDNFPSLVVYLSLLAVASDPNLWQFYNEDNLIFTKNDYADPGKSEIFNRLKKSSDATVAKLAESLEECCGLPVDQVPDLETILQNIPQSTASLPPVRSTTTPSPVAPSPPIAPPAPAPQSANPPTTSGSGYRQILQVQPTATPRVGGPSPATGVASSAPRPMTQRSVGSTSSPSRPFSLAGMLAQIRQNFRDTVAELRINARYYEFKKVALGVGIIAATISVLLVTMIALGTLLSPS